MLELQAALTLTFNTICIGYSTLMAANFVLGLMETWRNAPKPLSLEPLAITTIEPLQEETLAQITENQLPEPEPDYSAPTLKGWDVVEPVGYSIRELKAIAKARHIKGYGKMTKQQLAETLAIA